MARKKIDIAAIATKAGMVAAGGVGAGFLNDKVMPNMNPKLKAGATVALGAVLPMVAPKTAMLENIGDGMIAVGADRLVQSFMNPAPPPVEGLGAADDIFDDLVDEEALVEGVDDVLEGIGEDGDEDDYDEDLDDLN